MSILALDTSIRGRLVAVFVQDDGSAVGWSGRVIRLPTLDVSLPTLLAELRDGREPLRAVVVVTGPGSLTGVRAGMAAALGVSIASRAPLHGLGALDVVAVAAAASLPEVPTSAWAVADAGRGGLHVARMCRSDGLLQQQGAAMRVDGATWEPSDGAVILAAETLDPAILVASRAHVAAADGSIVAGLALGARMASLRAPLDTVDLRAVELHAPGTPELPRPLTGV